MALNKKIPVNTSLVSSRSRSDGTIDYMISPQWWKFFNDFTNVAVTSSATGSSGQVLTTDGSNYIFTSAKYPTTISSNNLLFASGTNNVVGLPTMGDAVLKADTSGTPSFSQTLPTPVQNNITTVANNAITTPKLANAAVSYAKIQTVSAYRLLGNTTNAASTIAEIPANAILTGRGNFTTGTLATGTTVIPDDNTIPQSNEGDQYMALTYTPQSSTNYLEITVSIFVSTSALGQVIVSLFQDSNVNAIAVGCQTAAVMGMVQAISFTYPMVAGTTSSTTFKVRCGAQAGTITFNGMGGNARFGGTYASSIRIQEFTA